MNAKLLLDNKYIFEGISIGAQGTAYGEICFNTSMAGYQEILTDPSYAEQIIVMTYPEIGNYGINQTDFENERVFAKGFVVKNYCKQESHYKSTQTLSNYLKENNIIGISNVDTRKITTIIREKGTMPCLITTEEITEEMKEKLSNWKMSKDIAKFASKGEYYHISGTGPQITVVDFGIKNSILKNLINLDCDIKVYPPTVNSEELLKEMPDAILLSNGPGDPQDAKQAIEMTKELIGKIPLYGICLGYQILCIALGGTTYKLKYGHRGGNHPVINLKSQKVLLTSQNHGYAVEKKSLPANINVTYENLNDGTTEGFSCPELKIEAVQFHPEASPGPTDAEGIFRSWIKQIEGFKKCQKI